MIEVRGLSKHYRSIPVLTDVDVVLPSGKIAFLMGKNGAGKTTLLKTMLELENHSGEVLYGGQRLQGVYGEVAVVYDDSPVHKNLTGRQNIEVLCGRRVGNSDIARFTADFITQSELSRRAKTYSYGQQKKLAIAIALLGEPKYLMMDEVSNGLDYATMEWLKRELRERAGSTTILLTGHQFDFYNSIVDRVLILKDTRVTEVDFLSTSTESTGLGVLYESAFANAQG